MSNNYPHRIEFNDEFKRKADKAAALLDLKNWGEACSIGIDLAVKYAGDRVKGKVWHSMSQSLSESIDKDPEFFEALTEEGVVEWLRPLVMTGGKDKTTPSPIDRLEGLAWELDALRDS